jgi:hypothetical protein
VIDPSAELDPLSIGRNRRWAVVAALAGWEARVGAWVRRQGAVTSAAYEFLRFGITQAWACLFGGLLLGLIVATRLWYPHGVALPRYDALVLACLVVQTALLLSGLETIEEAKVILVFHLVGTGMELFKTATENKELVARIRGSPDMANFRFGTLVPLKGLLIRLLDRLLAGFAGFRARKDRQRQQDISRSVSLNDWADQGAQIGLAGGQACFDRDQQHFVARRAEDSRDHGVENAIDCPDLFLDWAWCDLRTADI